VNKPLNVLFVCTANQQRSPTGERMYTEDPRFHVRSAGTHAFANHRVDEADLRWADIVVAMEERHARSIRELFPKASAGVRMIVLDIPDIYRFMDPQLVPEIRERFEAALRRQ
jgi:predicted protein tyrosine phosphatase